MKYLEAPLSKNTYNRRTHEPAARIRSRKYAISSLVVRSLLRLWSEPEQ